MESASVPAPNIPGSGSGHRGRQGAQNRSDRLRLQPRDRDRLDRARLQHRGDLGFVTAVAGMGFHAPAVMIVSFIPMLLIAAAYNYMNKADPDCGTSFTWVTRALGPTWAG